jgi:serine/threonine-protein kinase
MPLTSGTTLGVYRISGLLGKGGMGEVYRARDEKLARDVALKILPPEFASDPDRVARFGREARLLASLSHPNVAGIHGLEESGDRRFLVLELIEGETLAERLTRPLSIEQALRIAVQIATALEAAHAKGIIHRDLKPGNIKVAPDGTVKVLDFGLAKAYGPAAAGDVDLSHSPTLSINATAHGVILGTAGYMSPEQARGEEVNKQADIWSFGCILFEMLTGRQTWPGRSITDIIASLVAREPEWTRLPAGLHPRVRFVLERCLEKDPADRYREIADARLEIAKALTENQGASPAVVVRDTRWSMGMWAALAAAALGLVLAGGAAAWLLKPDPARPTVARFGQNLPPSFTQTSIPPFPLIAISKDGKRWAFSTIAQLYVRNLAETEFRPLQGVTAQGVVSPTFSPDGEWIAFVETPTTSSFGGIAIRKLPVTGGTPQTVVPLTAVTSVEAVMGVDVNWDDRNMLTWVQPQGIMQVSANGGEPEMIVKARDGERLASPQILPGGDAILFTATRAIGGSRWDAAEIVVQSLGSDDRTVLWRGGHDARYISTGHIVYAQGSTLFALAFDRVRRTITGGQTPVLEGLPILNSVPVASDTAQFAVSDEGSLIYLTGGTELTAASGNGPPPRTLAWVDRKGTETAIRIRADDYTMARVSPDGKKVALVVGNAVGASNPADIWVYDIATENARQLTFGTADDDGPVWASDSSRVYFRSFQDGDETHAGVYWVSADGGEPTRVAMSNDYALALPWSLSSDGHTMALVNARTFEDVSLATLDISGKDAFQLLLKGPPSVLSEPVIAPNGRWIAYLQAAAGADSEIDIRPFPDVARQRYPVGLGGHPAFSRDGSELFFFDGQGLSVVPVSYQPSFRIGAVQQLFRKQYWYGVNGLDGGLGRAWDIDPRSGRFLMIRLPGAVTTSSGGEAPSPPIRLNVVLNWLEELKQRVPSR